MSEPKLRSRPGHHRVIALCVTAGILYNSWPLGYALDRPTARGGLASDLENPGHPYYWLFIVCDVLTGLLVLGAAWLIWRGTASKTSRDRSKLLATCLAIFGIFTMLCALVPLQHDVAAFKFFEAGNSGVGLDALTNCFAELGILAGLALAVSDRDSWKTSRGYAYAITAVSILWIASGIWFIIPAVTGGNAHLAQQALLITTGLAIVGIGFAARKRAN